MAGDQQVTAVVARLGDALALVNPVKLVSVMRTVTREVGTPPPGDPEALRTLATTCRTTAARLRAVPRPTTTPAAAGGWDGVVATSAAQVARSVGDALAAAPGAFETAAAVLDTLAERVADQHRRHAELHERLRAAVHDATHIGSVPAPDPGALDDLARASAGLIRGCIAVYTDAMAAADEAAVVFADVAGAARAAAAVGGGLAAGDALVVAAQDVVVAGIGGGYDDGVLTLAQLRRAGGRLDDHARDLLARAGSTTERAYLLKAVAAAHPAEALRAFADDIRGRDDAWLHHHLSLVDRGGAGAQDRFGAEVDQYDDFTCGTTSVIVARAEADPLYAHALTRGLEPPYDPADREEFDRRLSAEQARVHDETNTVWPRRFGTLPSGVAAWMNRHVDVTGVRYGWHLVDDTDRRAVTASLREVVTAVDAGHPVPILVGGAVPRHYVLVVGHAGSDLLIFEPSSGDTRRVPVADFEGGRMKATAGFDHVQAVIVPK